MKKLATILMLIIAATLSTWATNTKAKTSDGSSMDDAIELVEGENNIPLLKMGDDVRWYKTTAKGMKRTKVTFSGYPVLMAYLGSDLSKSLGFNNPVDYINLEGDQDLYIRLESTNEEELTATVTYGEPVPDLTSFGPLTYSIEKNDDVPAGSAIAISFPERVGGADGDAVLLNYYIFNIKGGNPDGAPVNLGGKTTAEGTLSDGVSVTIDGLNIGKKYRLSIQSLHSGNHFAPGINEQTLTPGYIDFYFTESTGITTIKTTDDNTLRYNVSGQRISGPAKGIVIMNGSKYIK